MVDGNEKIYADTLLKVIRSVTMQPVKKLICTHWHYDHCGSNVYFGEETEIIADSRCCELLSKPSFLLGDSIPACAGSECPDICITNDTTIEIDDERLRLISLSCGHSSGDLIVVFEKSGIVHLGDIVFSGQFPFVDLEHGGNAYTLRENISFLLKKFSQTTVFVPGHGNNLSYKDLEKYYAMIDQTILYVENELKNGRTPVLPEKWSCWNGSFTSQDWVSYIVASSKMRSKIHPE